MQPKVSVIVPVYKVENYLTQCLDSIVRQSLKDIEIIIIDEGDKDRCREIIDYFESFDKRIVTVHERQGGYGNSVNRGFELARGEYISIIESDDFVESDMIEKLYAQIKRFDADIVKSPYYEYRDPGNKRILPIMKELMLQLPEDKAFTARQYPILFSTHPSIWAGLYRSNWLKKTGIYFLPKGAYLDIQFRFETLFAAEKICWVNEPFYYWRITNPTSTNASWNLKAAFDRWNYIHSQFEGKEALWNAFATYMLPEENLNIFIRYRMFGCSSEEKKKIKEYLSLYPVDAIRYNPYVDPYFKSNFLLGNPSSLFIKRKIKGFLKKITSIQMRHFSYKAFIVFGVAALTFCSIPCDTSLLASVKSVLGIVTPLVFALFAAYWAGIFAVKFLKLTKRFLKI